MNEPTPEISIRRQINDHRIARVGLKRLQDLHWSDVSGGVNAVLPQSFIHGYVWCDEIKGEIAHSGVHGPCPHRIKVVILKADNPDVYSELLAIVGPKRHLDQAKPYTKKMCQQDAYEILTALLTGASHPAIEYRPTTKHGPLYVILPKRIRHLNEGCSEGTSNRRAKKLKIEIEKQSRSNVRIQPISYGWNLAYKTRDDDPHQ